MPDGSLKAKNGGVVGFYSLERSAEQLATRIISEQSEVSASKIRRGDITEADFDKLVAGLKAAYRRWPTGIYALWYPVKDLVAIGSPSSASGRPVIDTSRTRIRSHPASNQPYAAIPAARQTRNAMATNMGAP